MIVLGIDPGMAAGKPIAIAAIEIGADHVSALWHCDRVVSDSGPTGFNEWMDALREAVGRWQPQLIAVEDALAPNLRSAAALQRVVLSAELISQSAGVPIIKVHPSRVRLAIAFNGRTPSSDEVVDTINILFGLNLTNDQHDTAFAYAVAMAGEAQWRSTRVLEMASNPSI